MTQGLPSRRADCIPSDMKLYATPLSHFSRKVRLVLDRYAVPYESFDVGNVAEDAPAKFADNPLAKVPVLVDAGTWLIESDHIAAYLSRKYDAGDALGVRTEDVFDLNARALLNGMMAEEVKLILAKRTGVPVERYSFFDKSFASLKQGFEWLERHAGRFEPEAPKYRDLHLVCLWDHIAYYDLVPLGGYPGLRNAVAKISADPLVLKSAPLTLKPR